MALEVTMRGEERWRMLCYSGTLQPMSSARKLDITPSNIKEPYVAPGAWIVAQHVHNAAHAPSFTWQFY